MTLAISHRHSGTDNQYRDPDNQHSGSEHKHRDGAPGGVAPRPSPWSGRPGLRLVPPLPEEPPEAVLEDLCVDDVGEDPPPVADLGWREAERSVDIPARAPRPARGPRPASALRPARALHRRPVRLTRRGRIVVGLLLLGLAVGAMILLAPASQAATPPGPMRTVVVHHGDTMWSIASSALPDEDPSTAVREVRALNHLADNTVYVGEQLLLPPS